MHEVVMQVARVGKLERCYVASMAGHVGAMRWRAYDWRGIAWIVLWSVAMEWCETEARIDARLHRCQGWRMLHACAMQLMLACNALVGCWLAMRLCVGGLRSITTRCTATNRGGCEPPTHALMLSWAYT